MSCHSCVQDIADESECMVGCGIAAREKFSLAGLLSFEFFSKVMLA